MPLAALPSVGAILPPVSSGQGEIVHRTRRGKDPGNLGCIDSRDQEDASVIVPAIGTPFTVSALPARSPKLSTIRVRVVPPTVACTPVLGVAALMAAAIARALAAASTVEKWIIGSLGRTYTHAIDREIVDTQGRQRCRCRTAHCAYRGGLHRER